MARFARFCCCGKLFDVFLRVFRQFLALFPCRLCELFAQLGHVGTHFVQLLQKLGKIQRRLDRCHRIDHKID